MELHEYQKRIVNFLHTHKNAILSVDMGLGKTISVLTYLEQTQPGSVLIIAPKRVAESVWAQEAAKWGLTIADKFIVCKGPAAKRRAALQDQSKPYKIVSRDNIKDVAYTTWAVLILDELTSFKNVESARTKTVLSIKAPQRIGLTGTFLANGAIDIYGQAAACGLRLSPTFYAWRACNFRDALQGSGLQFSKWVPTKTLEELLRKIKDDIFTLTADDYLTIPPKVEQVQAVQLDKDTQKAVKELDAFLSCEIGDEIFAINDKQKFAKLQTLTNGFVYDDDGRSIRAARSTKLEKVAEYVAECVEQGEHVLLFYAYREEALWLGELLTEKGVKFCSVANGNFLALWNEGKIDVLFAHPASAGHGLNLQHGGRVIVWSTLTYNYELFAQGNARLARQGQRNNVLINYFVAAGTVEERIVKALTQKNEQQQIFLQLTK